MRLSRPLPTRRHAHAPARHHTGGRRPGRRCLAAAVAALVASGLGVLPTTVTAAAAAASDIETPTEIDGSEPGASGDPLPAGTYTTKLPAVDAEEGEEAGGGRAHVFTLNKGANNALWVTATSDRPADPDLAGEVAMELRAPGGNGATCGGTLSTGISSSTPGPRQQAALFTPAKVAGEDSACASATTLELHAVYGYGSESDATPPTTSPTTLLSVMTEPPISQADTLPAESDDGSTTGNDDLAWRPESSKSTPVKGADSFTKATAIEPGLYTDALRSGQTRAYRFRLDFGQRARVMTRFQDGRELDDPNFPEDGVEVAQSTYNPALAHISNVTGTVTLEPDDSDAGPLGEQLPTVRYSNRETLSQTPPKQNSVAGYYYVLVSAQDAEPGFTLPFALDVQVEGQPSGQPTYLDGEPSWPEGMPVRPGTTPQPSATPGASPSRAAGDDGGAIDLARVGIGGGLVVVLVALAGLLVARARRS